MYKHFSCSFCTKTYNDVSSPLLTWICLGTFLMTTVKHIIRVQDTLQDTGCSTKPAGLQINKGYGLMYILAVSKGKGKLLTRMVLQLLHDPCSQTNLLNPHNIDLGWNMDKAGVVCYTFGSLRAPSRRVLPGNLMPFPGADWKLFPMNFISLRVL